MAWIGQWVLARQALPLQNLHFLGGTVLSHVTRPPRKSAGLFISEGAHEVGTHLLAAGECWSSPSAAQAFATATGS
jgi:hypothetical protein